jgi:hypothetical protein
MSAIPANNEIPVKRNFSRNFTRSSLASQVMQALENNFSGFANTTGGNTFTIFSCGSPKLETDCFSSQSKVGNAVSHTPLIPLVQQVGERLTLNLTPESIDQTGPSPAPKSAHRNKGISGRGVIGGWSTLRFPDSTRMWGPDASSPL